MIECKENNAKYPDKVQDFEEHDMVAIDGTLGEEICVLIRQHRTASVHMVSLTRAHSYYTTPENISCRKFTGTLEVS